MEVSPICRSKPGSIRHGSTMRARRPPPQSAHRRWLVAGREPVAPRLLSRGHAVRLQLHAVANLDVGLNPLDLPLVTGGITETFGAQWDAEWSDRFFTSVSYQHQTFDGLVARYPKLLGTFDATTGRIDRVGVAANYWIGGGLGAFGNIAWNQSKSTSPLFGPATRCRSFPSTRDSSASPMSARGGSR